MLDALGNGPTDRLNMSNCPGGMADAGLVALKSTCDTYWVIIDPSSPGTGLGSGFLLTVAVQPAFGWVSTEVNGVLAGKVISSPVVDAVADSVGTRKVSTPEPAWTV